MGPSPTTYQLAFFHASERQVMIARKGIMKNLVHTVASFSIVVWLTGYLVYDTGGSFHYFLLTAIVAAIMRVFMEKKFASPKVRKNASRHI